MQIEDVINEETIKIEIDKRDAPGTEPQPWSPLKFTENELTVQLHFEKPLSISTLDM